MRRLPVPARLAEALARNQLKVSDFGQDGAYYEFWIRPVGANTLFAVVSAPVSENPWGFAGAWAGVFLVVLASAFILVVIWLVPTAGASAPCAISKTSRTRSLGARALP